MGRSAGAQTGYYKNRSRSVANEFVEVYYRDGIDKAKEVLVKRLTGTLNLLKRKTISEIYNVLGKIDLEDMI